jgi:hypothetical protein
MSEGYLNNRNMWIYLETHLNTILMHLDTSHINRMFLNTVRKIAAIPES